MNSFPIILPPRHWTAMLKRIQTKFPEALIGGGCLRDLQFNKPVNDIDIFLNGSYEHNIRNTLELTTGHQVLLDQTVTHNNVIYPQTIGHVFCLGAHGEKYQIIQKGHNIDPLTILDTFDIGLCMICWDGYDYTTNNHFIVDSLLHRITLVNPKEHSSLNHQNRVRSKYQGWPWYSSPDLKLVASMKALRGY